MGKGDSGIRTYNLRHSFHIPYPLSYESNYYYNQLNIRWKADFFPSLGKKWAFSQFFLRVGKNGLFMLYLIDFIKILDCGWIDLIVDCCIEGLGFESRYLSLFYNYRLWEGRGGSGIRTYNLQAGWYDVYVIHNAVIDKMILHQLEWTIR